MCTRIDPDLLFTFDDLVGQLLEKVAIICGRRGSPRTSWAAISFNIYPNYTIANASQIVDELIGLIDRRLAATRE
jgi:hypothetical protein